MINEWFNKLFVIKRNTWLTDEYNNQYSEETEVGQFMGQLQQASAELVQNFALTFTTAYSIWCPLNTDVRVGDVLYSVVGNFSVKAVQKFENGINRHTEIVAQLDEVTGS